MNKREALAGLVTAGVLAMCCAAPARALEMGVFGDMSLSHSNAPESEPSFRLGSLDLYGLQYIDDDTRVLFETQFQTFSGGEMTIEIQRFWIMREISDALHLGAGRFHTPLGYWNRHFHHGILMQDTVSRPFFLAFEGGSANAILPTHLIGLLAEGEIAYGLRYEAAVSNSNSIDSSEVSGEDSGLAVPNRADLGPQKTLYGRISYDDYQRPFKPGITVMHNRVREAADEGIALCTPASTLADVCRLGAFGEPLVEQTLYGFDLRYENGRVGLLSEIYYIENEPAPGIGDGRKRDSLAWFAQLGYQFNDRWRFTYRYEDLDFDGDDVYYMNPRLIGRQNVGTQSRNVFALRYDFSESNALMLETSLSDTQLAGSTTTTLLSWAFVMF